MSEPAEEKIARLTRERDEAEADRDALLAAIGFKPGPLGNELRRKVILDDAGGLRGAMVKARREAADVQCDADLWTMRMPEEWPGDTLLLRLWRQRREAVKRAKAAEAALAESERKRVEAVEALKPFADVAEFMSDFNEVDLSIELTGGYTLTMKPFYAAKEIVATPTQEAPHVES